MWCFTGARVARKSRRDGFRCASCRITVNGSTSTPPSTGAARRGGETNLMNTSSCRESDHLEMEPASSRPCYVSIDKWTNTLEPMPVSLLENVPVSREADLSEGKQMVSTAAARCCSKDIPPARVISGMPISKIDAAERNYSFTYDGLIATATPRRTSARFTARRPPRKTDGRKLRPPNDSPTLTIHRTILKASVPKEAYDQWTEAVNDPPSGRMSRLSHQGHGQDGQGEPFNAWVKPNFERNKMDFFRWNPDRAKRQGSGGQTRR